MREGDPDGEFIHNDAETEFGRPCWIVSVVNRDIVSTTEERIQELNGVWQARLHFIQSGEMSSEEAVVVNESIGKP
jgi:hypothetical protein